MDSTNELQVREALLATIGVAMELGMALYRSLPDEGATILAAMADLKQALQALRGA
jgi:hypothetical protein